MHIMVDIETYGNRDNAQILQLSAVAFELDGKVREPHEMLQSEERWFDKVVQRYKGGSRDPSNVAFWKHADQAAVLARIEGQPKHAVAETLEAFGKFVNLWLGSHGKIWARPPQFDLRIIRGNYRGAAPWHHSQECDLRTLLWLAAKVPQIVKAPDMAGKGLVKHYALHDAAVQATKAQAAYRALMIGPQFA